MRHKTLGPVDPSRDEDDPYLLLHTPSPGGPPAAIVRGSSPILSRKASRSGSAPSAAMPISLRNGAVISMLIVTKQSTWMRFCGQSEMRSVIYAPRKSRVHLILIPPTILPRNCVPQGSTPSVENPMGVRNGASISALAVLRPQGCEMRRPVPD